MYRGYYCDADLGMYYLHSRYYDPIVCRFINADVPDVITASPTVLTDKNLYAYCDNNPVMRTDHDGMFWGTLFDVVSLGFSIYDVCNNPDDVLAWLGLAGDLIDLLPVISGLGEATDLLRIGKNTDNLVDAAKAGQKAPIIIGENMKRVKKYADEIGGHAYRPWSNLPFDYDTAMRRNKRWINDMMKEGREIIDIGPDFARRRTGVSPSDFYNMERTQVKGYAKYKKVFIRNGKFGGLPGEW